MELCFQNKTRSSKWNGKFCVHDHGRVQQLLLLKAENKFCKLSFSLPSARQRNINSQKKKITFKILFSSRMEPTRRQKKKIIETQACVLKALGNFWSLLTGRHSQWQGQGAPRGGYRTCKAAHCHRDPGGSTLLCESTLSEHWLLRPPPTLSSSPSHCPSLSQFRGKGRDLPS